MPLRRRTLLSGAASVPLVATAGCTDAFGLGGDDGPPEHARWVAERNPETDFVYYAYLDVTAFGDFDDVTAAVSTPTDTPDGTRRTPTINNEVLPSDTLVGRPVGGIGLLASAASGFLRIGYGFIGGLLQDMADATPGPVQADTEGPDVGTLESTILTQQALVFEGSFDLDAVDEAAARFERSGDHEGTRVYEGTGVQGEFDLAFAVREDALVLGFPNVDQHGRSGEAATGTPTEPAGPRSKVETALDLEAGDEPRLADRSDDAEWALTRAGQGDAVISKWGSRERGPTPEPSDVDDPSLRPRNPEGETSSLTLRETELVTELAEVYAEGETPDREDVESSIDTTADDLVIEVEDTRVAVTGTWRLVTPTGN